jgi:hypothetical protein
MKEQVLVYFLNPDHKQSINMTASIYNTSLGKLVGYRIGPLLASEGFDRTTFLMLHSLFQCILFYFGKEMGNSSCTKEEPYRHQRNLTLPSHHIMIIGRLV